MAFKKLIASLPALLFIAVILLAPMRGAGQKEGGKDVLPEEKPLIGSLDGRMLFRAYCTACHGQDAKGGGPAADSLKTRPADLTRISERNGGRFPIMRVQSIISGEGVVTSPHGSREMPVWGPIFGQIGWDQNFGNVRIYNLAKYLESIQEKPFAPPFDGGVPMEPRSRINK